MSECGGRRGVGGGEEEEAFVRQVTTVRVRCPYCRSAEHRAVYSSVFVGMRIVHRQCMAPECQRPFQVAELDVVGSGE